MIEDLKNIEKQIDRLWQDIRRVRGEIPEYPDDIAAGVDQDLVEASQSLTDAENYVGVAAGRITAFEAARAKQRDENIQAAIALLESKGFIVGTKT